MTDITIILLVVGTAVIAASIASFITSRKMRRKVAYMLDALEDKELNFRFDEKKLIGRGISYCSILFLCNYDKHVIIILYFTLTH